MDDVTFEKVKKKISEIVVRSPYPEEPFHSINTLEWVLRLDPLADEAMQIAALGHDIERSDEKRRVQSSGFETFEQFKEAHALNSAQILSEIMEKEGFDEALTDNVARLVAHHESGGNERENILKNADTLSFFQVCLPLYFDRHGPERTRKRLVWGYRKLPPALRSLVIGMDYMDPKLGKLVRESIAE